MRIGLNEPDWNYIGSVLARSSDDEQAKFFKAFIKECQSWGTHYQVEMQLCYINNKLTKEEREVLGILSYEEDHR